MNDKKSNTIWVFSAKRTEVPAIQRQKHTKKIKRLSSAEPAFTAHTHTRKIGV